VVNGVAVNNIARWSYREQRWTAMGGGLNSEDDLQLTMTMLSLSPEPVGGAPQTDTPTARRVQPSRLGAAPLDEEHSEPYAVVLGGSFPRICSAGRSATLTVYSPRTDRWTFNCDQVSQLDISESQRIKQVQIASAGVLFVLVVDEHSYSSQPPTVHVFTPWEGWAPQTPVTPPVSALPLGDACTSCMVAMLFTGARQAHISDPLPANVTLISNVNQSPSSTVDLLSVSLSTAPVFRVQARSRFAAALWGTGGSTSSSWDLYNACAPSPTQARAQARGAVEAGGQGRSRSSNRLSAGTMPATIASAATAAERPPLHSILARERQSSALRSPIATNHTDFQFFDLVQINTFILGTVYTSW
jgi:hypothetical protein